MEHLWKADVAFVISQSYIGQFKVTFNSLVNANPECEFCVHLFHGDLNEVDVQDLQRFVNERDCGMVFYKIDDSVFNGLPKMKEDVSYSAYYKILLPYYLKPISKVLFLDCDIIVRGSIKPLFEYETDAFLSCVADYNINHKRREHIKLITGSEDSTYFNSGVMLFNFLKAENIVPKEKLFDFIEKNRDIIIWHDQDILNHFYSSDCMILPEKYNYLTTYKSLSDLFVPKGKKQAVIIHYANWKPWRSNYIGKCYNLYKKNYKILKGEKGVDFLKRRSLFSQLKLIFKYIF